jgi:hypothetical protein
MEGCGRCPGCVAGAECAVGDFSENEIEFLHRTDVMLEGAYVTALRSAA